MAAIPGGGIKRQLDRARRLYAEKGPAVIGAGTVYYLSRKHRALAHWLEHRLRLPWRAAEYHRQYDVSVPQTLVPLRHGFDPKYYYFLSLDSRDESQYIPNHYPIREANGDANIVLNDKVAIYRIFSEYTSYFPELYGTIHNGTYFPQNDDGAETLKETVDRHGEVIAKPVTGYEGRDIFKIERTEDGYLVNGRPASPPELSGIQSDVDEDYLVTAVLANHDYAAEIFPESANTIRLLTAIDPDSGDSTVVRAVHRFGTAASAPTDNWENGGVAAPIDHVTGEIQAAVTLNESGKRDEIETHPDTGARIEGVTIPMWDDLLALATEAHQAYAVSKIIGWDVVVTDDGPMFLEASGRPGSHMLQLDSGLLEDDVIRRVFESEGVSV